MAKWRTRLMQPGRCACAVNFIRGSVRQGSWRDREEFVDSSLKVDKQVVRISKCQDTMTIRSRSPSAWTPSMWVCDLGRRTDRFVERSQHARKLLGGSRGRELVQGCSNAIGQTAVMDSLLANQHTAYARHPVTHKWKV